MPSRSSSPPSDASSGKKPRTAAEGQNGSPYWCGRVMNECLFSPSGFSVDSRPFCSRPRLAALGSFPRRAARGTALHRDPTSSVSDPALSPLSSALLPCPSSSWITWHRKSWVSRSAAAWSSSSGSSGSPISEETSESLGSETEKETVVRCPRLRGDAHTLRPRIRPISLV